MTDAGLYVHVPFCLARCGYCDFNAYAGLDALAPRYLRALRREADLASAAWSSTRFASIFLGGGTPTTLAPAALGALLAHLRERFAVAADAEVTIEANPDTVEARGLEGLAEAGFRRLSMGAQSFDPAVLSALERAHAPEAVRQAFAAARSAGHDNINLDLIYGATGETLASWRRTLEEAIALGPEHLSAYALTVEPATPLGRKVAAGLVAPPDPDLQADMYELACRLLADAGYGHYEVSNWARDGYACRHNLGYWRRRPYLGLGAGAHSFRDGRRWWNLRRPEAYLAAVEAGESPVGGGERLSAEDDRLEEVLLRLRTFDGIPEAWGERERERVAAFVDEGLLERRDGMLAPTERGLFVLNEVALALTAAT
jgi:putative oxygen-independent coproporphyrinogen III oxidase